MKLFFFFFLKNDNMIHLTISLFPKFIVHFMLFFWLCLVTSFKHRIILNINLILLIFLMPLRGVNEKKNKKIRNVSVKTLG